VSVAERALRVLDGGALSAEQPWADVLAAALRPEFMVDVYYPERGEPILFGHACAIEGCPGRGSSHPGRASERWLCSSHLQAWVVAGRPPVEGWLGAGVKPLAAKMFVASKQPCAAVGCVRSRRDGWWCYFHYQRWVREGRPDRESFAQAASPAPGGDRECEVPGCQFPAMRRMRRLCDAHKQSAKNSRRLTGLDVDGYLGLLARDEALRVPQYDFSALVEPLRSELRFVIQHRLDEGRFTLHYRRVACAVEFLESLGVSSLLERDQGWWELQLERRWLSEHHSGSAEKGFIRYARVSVAHLRDRASGVDPYAADIWLVEALGIPEFAYQDLRTISFVGIEPRWFREIVKRWARWRLRAGTLSPRSVAGKAAALKVFSDFLRERGEALAAPERLTRELLEDYRAYVRAFGWTPTWKHCLLGDLKVLLDEVRANGWEPRLPVTATYYRGEVPAKSNALPRAVDEHVMRQIEQPENIARLPDLTTQTIVILLIKTALRGVDATRLPFDPVVFDAARAPVLLYYNHKLKRDAAMPIDDALVAAIRAQQESLRSQFPEGSRWLFPGPRVYRGSTVPLAVRTLRYRIQHWLADSEVRDALGQRVHVSVHQFRHTLATRMVNNDVPLMVIKGLLDHSSIAMTEIYARLKDETLKREWENYNQRVNIRGEIISIDLAGAVSEAAWMKERLARAKQSLPNGYCGLPLQQSCPHPNACLSCDHFLTTEEFLPVHRDQLAETERLIAQADSEGSERKQEMNESVRVNLVRIIEGLESIAEHSPDGAGSREVG
jgi:integrase